MCSLSKPQNNCGCADASILRALVLVDLENLCGTSHIDRSLVAEVQGELQATKRLKETDHYVLGVSHINQDAAMRGWRGKKTLRTGSGPNGADNQLRKALYSLRKTHSYSQVVIASGDGVFIDDVQFLSSCKSKVCVIARADSINRKLLRFTQDFVSLSSNTPRTCSIWGASIKL